MTLPIQIGLHAGATLTAQAQQQALVQWLDANMLSGMVQISTPSAQACLGLGLTEALQQQDWAQACDTLSLRTQFGLGEGSGERVREIVLAMGASPVPLRFASLAEFQANVRARCNIAHIAAQAQLRFDTKAVDRPTAFWTYDEDAGFVLNPGCSLLEALHAALVPDASGHAYSFSCYRASEYVMLYGIAQELLLSYPQLYARLETRWRSQPIASRRFHDVFVHEVGSTTEPLPQRFYIPGDRIWFRNPDETSADVSGYEGSWVIYLGGGVFSNFWDRTQPFTLEGKCLELFCWQHAVRRPRQGEAYIDEPLVSDLVRGLLLGDADRRQTIVQRMMRYRDVSGTYAEGGCIDSTREFINAFEHGEPVLGF